MDLFEQEVLVATFLRGERIPGDLPWGPLDRLTVKVKEGDSGAGYLSHLAIVEEHDLAGVVEQSWDIRSDKVLALAQADDNRCGVLRSEDCVGLAFTESDDGERAFEPPQRRTRRFAEGPPLPEVLVDQMRDHFGIGFRAEHPALSREFMAQLQVVLDDAVMDHDDLAGAVRMRVFFRRTAVGGPARMAHAHGAVHGLGVQQLIEVAQLAH